MPTEKYDIKEMNASEVAEVVAVAYAKCKTKNERKLLAELASEIGEVVTFDARQFVMEVLDRAAGKLPGPVQLHDDEMPQ